MLRIVTDTGSDVTYLGAKDVGMEVVELDVKFDEFPYDHRNDTDFSVFYDNLTKAKNLPRTSQVNPSQYLEIFNDAKTEGDEVFVLTLASGISGTYSSAKIAEEECGYDGITVVDSRQAIVSQRAMADRAVEMRDAGKTRAEIEEFMISIRDRMSLVACLDTLTYLKKGGRVPPAMALIGNAIKIKPVVILAGGKIVPLGKARGFASAQRTVWDQFEKDGYDESWPVCFGYTFNEERGKAFMEETVAKYNIKNYRLYPVGGVIGTHAGPNAVVITYLAK